MTRQFKITTLTLLGISTVVSITATAIPAQSGAMVRLQAVNPGTAQIGNINVSGTIRSGSLVGSGSGITNILWNSIVGRPGSYPPGGTAGGSLTGTYPNPGIADLAVTNANIVSVDFAKITNAPPFGLILPYDGFGYGVTNAFSVTNTNSSGNAIYGFSTSAVGVFGKSTAGNGAQGSSVSGTGVYGTSVSGWAIVGDSPVLGVSGRSTDGRGVWGQSSTNDGVYGTSGSGVGISGLSVLSIGALGQSTSGTGVYGTSTSGWAIIGDSPILGVSGRSTNGRGVWGQSSTNDGVYGTSGSGTGVSGHSSAGTGTQGSSSSGTGVYGTSTSGWAIIGDSPILGVSGRSTDGRGVWGQSSTNDGVYGTSGSGTGVSGLSTSSFGMFGQSTSATGVQGSSNVGVGVGGSSQTWIGVVGESTSYVGVYASSGTGYGLIADTADKWGVTGRTNSNSTTARGVSGHSSHGFAIWGGSEFGKSGLFINDVLVTGMLEKGGGTFKIDHPLDPFNKYLTHSFVESPDMMNIYNGVVVTDGQGYAVVEMPNWFQSVNRDFRYQLTVVDELDSDDFVQVKVVSNIKGNRFTVRSSAPNVEVSWQVTGIRQDNFANANRPQVEQEKSARDRGKLLHPEAAGYPSDFAMYPLEAGPRPDVRTKNNGN